MGLEDKMNPEMETTRKDLHHGLLGLSRKLYTEANKIQGITYMYIYTYMYICI